MVRETEPDKPLPLVSEGPLNIPLPTKQPLAGPHIGVVTVTTKPTLWQRFKAAWRESKS